MKTAELEASEEYALFCEGLLTDPYPLFDTLRAEDPVHWSDRLSGWVLTRHDDITAGHRDTRFASERASLNMEPLPPEMRQKFAPLGEHVANWLGFTDPPKHTRLRKMVARSMSAKFIAGLRPRIGEIVDGLLAKVEGKNEMDLMGEFAYPLPATVGCELLGIPPGDQDTCKDHIDALVNFVGGVGPQLIQAAEPAYQSYQMLAEYFRELADERRRKPTDDMFTALVNGLDSGEILDETELLGLSVFLYVAGHETTVGLIINGLLSLLLHPGQLELLMNDWSLVDSAVEECLRYEAPIQLSTRLTVEDGELRGREIKKGDAVVWLLGAANRDPEVFENPHVFDIRRKENRHVAFGVGSHFCLGAPLARLEAQLAFPALFKRYPNLRLKTEELTWRKNMTLRAVVELPVILE